MTSNLLTQSPEQVICCPAEPKFDVQNAAACEFSFEKFVGGFRIRCRCKDTLECTELQALCDAICERECTICCVRDGVQICNFDLCCGKCKCECVADGCTFTYSSRGAKCSDMLKAICDCLACCCENDCCCYICFGGTCCCFGGCN